MSAGILNSPWWVLFPLSSLLGAALAIVTRIVDWAWDRLTTVFLDIQQQSGFPPFDADAKVRKADLLRACNSGERDQDPASIGRLLDGLQDTHPANRAFAAAALGELGIRRAAPFVSRLLDANRPQVRAVALWSLAKLRVADIAERASEMAETDEASFVRASAMHALVTLAQSGTTPQVDLVPFLVRFLDDPDWNVRNGAAIALGNLGDRRALDPLRRAKRNARHFTHGPMRQAIRKIKKHGKPVASSFTPT